MWDELGISPCDDPKAIRRAYAARLKKLDLDSDPAGFARLRDAFEAALAEAEGAASAFDRPDARRGHPFDLADQPEIGEPSADVYIPGSKEPAAADASADTTTEWFDGATSDSTLLSELESALSRNDAATALSLYYRSAASGAMPLHAAPPLLNRLFAQVIEEPTIDRTAIRDLARISGWDRPAAEGEAPSNVRQRVLARLAAEDWYDSQTALAERHGKTPRKRAKLARLMLGRIGKYWMPWVDRLALKAMLDEFRTHESWLSDRISPTWARTLEQRWRRREIAWMSFFALLMVAMLLNWLRLFVIEVAGGNLSAGMILTPFAAAFLLWLLKLIVRQIREAIKFSTRATGRDPPDNLDARLDWLERQAESAYEAMYDAPAGAELSARYNDAKEFLHDAIELAKRLGRTATVARLSQRLATIKAVYRSQFPGQ